MKKKWAVVLWVFWLCITVLLVWCTSKYISENDAKKIVLEDSHWTMDDVIFTEVDLDRGDGIYKIEFIADEQYNYEYEINAVNWEIIVDEDFPVYTMKDAQDIAVFDAGFTLDDVKIISAQEEKEWWQTSYEIEFLWWNYAYEYNISASDGSIVSVEKKSNQE